MLANQKNKNSDVNSYGTPIASPDSLVNELTGYSMYDTLSRVSGLLTVPSLQSNAFRIENLIHLVANHCHGRKKPSYAKLMKWLNDDLSSIAYYEDPAEDVFISNISSPHGNFRLFEGIWESSSFYTQIFVDILCSQNTPKVFNECRAHILNILKLSELVCKRLDLPRWTSVESLPQNEVNLPKHSEIVLRSKALVFNREDLEQEGIEVDLLHPFIAKDWSVYDCSNDTIGNSFLERYPLLQINDYYVLSVPSAVNPAIRRYGLELVKELGLIDVFERVLRNYYLRNLDKGISHFKDLEPIKNVEPKDIAPKIENVSIAVGCFDKNKTILFITIHDPVSEIIENGLSSGYSPDEEYCSKISNYIDIACSHFEKKGYDGGVIAVNICGIGRYANMGFNFKNKNWRFVTFNPDNLSTLSYDENWSCLRFWKFLTQKKELSDNDIKIIPGFDNFLTYAFWKETDFFFLNADVSYPQTNMLNIAFDYSLPLRKSIKEKVDRHSIYIKNLDRNIDFCRFGQNPYFKYDYKLPMYASESMAMAKVLFGAVELDDVTWSISFDSENSIAPFRLQYKLWESAFNWLYHIVLFFKGQTDLNFPNNAHILLSTGKVFDWEHPPKKEEETKTKVSITNTEINIELGSNILPLFMQPQNNAEKEMVSHIVKALLNMEGYDLSHVELEDVLSTIIPSDFSRYIHMYEPHNPIDNFKLMDDSDKSRLVQEEDIARNFLGLVWKFSDYSEKAEIKDFDACLDFLKDGVAYLWLQIKNKIQNYQKNDLIELALFQIEALAAENQHWKNTSRALLELSKNKEELYNKARSMQNERDQASLCYRILVEIANCECDIESKKILTQSEVDDIIAKISILLEFASRREAISYEMSLPEITLNANGTIRTENESLELIITNFSKAIHEVSFNYAVSTYEELYATDKPTNSLESIYGQDVIEAFSCEYNISLEQFLNVMLGLYDYALSQKSSVISMSFSEFKVMAFDKFKLNEDSWNGLLETFVYWPRDNWDKPQDGYNLNDILPWKYQRRLSIVMKPIIFTASEGGLVWFSVHSIYSSYSYYIDNIVEGRFKQEILKSSEMKALQGRTANKKGLEFEKIVCDLLEDKGMNTKPSVEMSSLGGEPELGEVDAFSWRTGNEIFIIECKRLKMAKNTSEIGEQLSNFKGDEGDYLAKHIRRVKWISDNAEQVCNFLGIQYDESIKFTPYIVTSRPVPMQFNPINVLLPQEQICDFNNLALIYES